MTATTTTATHYSLSIEIATYASEAGEILATVDLIATDSTTGKRWIYVGPAACSTQSEALDLMARIFNWEYTSGKALDPTRRPEFWAAEALPADGLPTATTAPGGPEVACTPSVWATGPANVAEVVEVVAPVEVVTPAKPRKPRARKVKVDAAKVKRGKAAGKAVAAEMVASG